MAGRVFPQRRPRGAQYAFGGLEVARFAQQMAEAEQHHRGDAVARGQRFVAEGLWPADEGLVIHRREIEAAALRVRELREHDLEQLAGEGQLIRVAAHAGEFEDGVGEEYVVIEIGVELGLGAGARGQQPAVAPVMRAQEGERGRGLPAHSSW